MILGPSDKLTITTTSTSETHVTVHYTIRGNQQLPVIGETEGKVYTSAVTDNCILSQESVLSPFEDLEVKNHHLDIKLLRIVNVGSDANTVTAKLDKDGTDTFILTKDTLQAGKACQYAS